MAIEALRPDTTLTGVAGTSTWSRTGGTTKHGVLADDSDATYLTATDTGGGTTGAWGFTSYTLAAGERVKKARAIVRASSSSTAACQLFFNYSSAAIPSGIVVDSGSTVDLSGTAPDDRAAAWVTGTPWPEAEASQQAVIDGLQLYLRWLNGSVPPRVHEAYLELDVWQRTDAPTVDSPTGTVTDTDQPTVQFYVANINDGAASLYYREVRVFRDEVYLAGGFDPSTEADVEWSEAAEGHTIGHSDAGLATSSGDPTEVTVATPLANSDTYRVYVREGKRDVAGQTLWSLWGYSEFTLDLTLPATPTVAVTVEQANGRQTVEVTTGTLTYDSIESLRVERSDDGGTTWATIRGGLISADPADGSPLAASTAYTFDDYDAPRGVSLLYRARIVEASSGNTIASAWGTAGAVTHDNDGQVWLFDVPTFAHVIGGVIIGWHPEVAVDEQVGVFRPLGRPDAVVVSAGIQGGDTALQVLAHGADTDTIEAVLTHTGPVLVKWDDGTQEYLRIVSRSYVRQDSGPVRWRPWSLGAVASSDQITADG